ncbi:hypothetical protein GGR57DRAFT_479898 [Xylariaceae sp. FL1272]|nr:hypothetical protein GGR57DRAFT_479898 [Xylariaceae sp. FL1272]
MALAGGSVFSETLQEITNAKLEELSKRRSQFENTKAKILADLDHEKATLERLRILSQGVKECYSMKTTESGEILTNHSRSPELEVELKHLESFLAQGKYDPSISTHTMAKWEESLLRHLNTQSSKFQYASLYAQLVTEWLSTEKAAANPGEDIAMSEGFEDVGDSMKKNYRAQWEKIVFESADVNDADLKTYLARLFRLGHAEKSAKVKALDKLREDVKAFETTMAMPNQFNAGTLGWVIRGLLASDLLTDDKREVLRDFQGNVTILNEVSDVLNMRLAALSNWSWGESVPLEQRRKITGIYNVLMHEDVLQAIFLHYIGVKWSVFFKRAFRNFRKFTGAWDMTSRTIPKIDQKRREYYLGSFNRGGSVQSARNKLYRRHYFVKALMANETQQSAALEGEEEAQHHHPLQDYQMQLMLLEQQNKKRLMMARQEQDQGTYMHSMPNTMQMQQAPMSAAPPPPPAPRRSLPRGGGVVRHRKVMPDDKRDISDDESDADSEAGANEVRRPMEDKQRLIRLVSTEIAVNTKLHGEITVLHAGFEGWLSLLPHESILIVIELLGVSPYWVEFFTKFLKAPLKFLDDPPSTAPRVRKRGTPASHVLSEVFGESILFCLDFAVNQATNGHNIHRMHDDFWFWSRDHEIVKTMWKAVQDFTNATRTCTSAGKSGTVRISTDPSTVHEIDGKLPVGDIRFGFLKLSAQTGQFEIDQSVVDKHIIDLRRQLADKRKSVISFIQTWNAIAATFFTSNFGKPANCFGKSHVDQMLETHQRIQAEVFSAPSPLLDGEAPPSEPITSVVGYLKHLLRSRFGVTDIPDAYLFFPVELGGLDLVSPFISILPLRDSVLADPSKELDRFLDLERDSYAEAKRAFERGLASHAYADTWAPENPEDRENFFSLAEFAKYREDIAYDFSGNLKQVFKRLLEVPPAHSGGIEQPSSKLNNGLNALANRGKIGNWWDMEPYWRWVAQMYGPEAMERFGGLDIVEPGLLPMGMVSIFREKRVRWED